MDRNKLFSELNKMDPSRTPDRNEVAHIARQVTDEEAADILEYAERSFKRNRHIPPIGHFVRIARDRADKERRLNPPPAEPRPKSFGDALDW